MIGYILFLVLGLFFTFLANAIYGEYNNLFSSLYAFFSVLINFLIILGLDIIISFIIHKLPKRLFNPYLKIYKVSKFEKKIFNSLGIKKWKDKIPDMGKLCDFKKNKVESNELNYLYKFMEETCYAEVIHIAMILIGFLDLLILRSRNILSITIPLVLINISLNFPPILVQRYNRPRLMTMIEYQKRHLDK